MLAKHQLWLNGDGGECADFSKCFMNGIYIAIGIVVLVGLIALAVWLYQRYHNEGMA